MISRKLINSGVKQFATNISSQSDPVIGCVEYKPEPWARWGACIDNVAIKIKESGGVARYGWLFYYHIPQIMPDQYYLSAQHHAVWYSTNLKLIDITPIDESKQSTLIKNGSDPIFLVDNEATPLPTPNHSRATHPIKFFAPGECNQLMQLVKELKSKEQLEWWKHFYI